MGREKLKKPRRPRIPTPPSPLESLLSQFERDSIWSVLTAAGRSPMYRKRWVTVGHLVAAASAVKSPGARRATAADIQMLLDAATADFPSLAEFEDFVPDDPREVAVVEAFGRLYRLFPGTVERPVADLDRMIELSRLFDEQIIATHGFGIRHLLEAVFERVDSEISAAASAWTELPTDDTGDPVLTDAEISVRTPASPDRSSQQQRALNWVTSARAGLRYDAGHPESTFEGTLRVISTGDTEARWVPLAFVPEGLAFAVARLVREVGDKPENRRRFAQSVAARTRRRLWRFSNLVTGAPDADDGPQVSPGNVVQWVITMGDTRVLAVQQNSSLTGEFARRSVPAAVRAREELEGGAASTVLPFPGGGRVTLREGASVTPILVAAAATHLVAMGPRGALHLSLEDLDWIAVSADDDTDLYHFAEEMSSLSSDAYILEAVNAWEVWRGRGGALTRGVSPDAIFIEQHGGSAEWRRAVRLSTIETALHALRLPPLRDWDIIDERSDGPAQLGEWNSLPARVTVPQNHHRPPLRSANLHLADRPVGIVFADTPGLSDQARELIFDLAGAFGFALDGVRDVWQSVLTELNVRAVRVSLEAAEQADAEPLTVDGSATDDGVASTVIRVGVGSFLERVVDAPLIARELMAGAMAKLLEQLGLSRLRVEAVQSAWIAAPPSLTVKSYEPVAERPLLTSPVGIEKPLLASVDRRVAAAIRDAGATPGEYAPDEAKAIDRDLLAPACFSLLDDQIRHHSYDDLLSFGMVQLERVLARREELLQDVARAHDALDVAWDPVTRQGEIESEYLRLRRSTELIVEAALLLSPVGAQHLDDRGWAELLAISATYFDFTMRSEGLHFQLLRSSLIISDLFELELKQETGDVDMAAYARAVAARNLEAVRKSPDAASLEELREKADRAFQRAEGSALTDVLTVLYALAGYPLAPEDPDAVALPRDVILDYVIRRSGLHDDQDIRARFNSALERVVSRPTDYIADDWQPWRLRSRRVRLITRPVPELANGALIVAPHFCLTAARVMRGYWETGQLPWVEDDASNLGKALGEVRSFRNLELERQVQKALEADGWTTVVRIKPGDGARIGVPTVTTEIDIVAGRADSPTIWILEVKDPSPVFAPPEIRRHLNRFIYDEKSYTVMLGRKAGELEAHARDIAKSLRMSPADYRTAAAFVTRDVVPAAFAGGPFSYFTLSSVVDDVQPPNKAGHTSEPTSP